jgi:hypothetical protein
MIYVSVDKNKENENFFVFDCTGCGWCKEDDLNKDYIDISCEDNYLGARGCTIKREFVHKCEVQKENPYKSYERRIK